MTIENTIDNDLKVIQELVYNPCGFSFTNFKQSSESLEYAACSFILNGKIIQYRNSKITPTKTGQFVSIWKRNNSGITEPFHILDDFDFMVITSKNDENLGQFIFPKSVLAANGIITQNDKEGKRGIRVYPPWYIATSKQAVKTQSWQTKYFLPIKNNNTTNLNLAMELFTM